MPYIEYTPKRFSAGSLEIIERADSIAVGYAAQGYDLTLRQLYYQFVARGWLANKQTEYKRLGSIVNDARLAGLIDWGHIVDRTRSHESNSHWDTPAAIIRSALASYRNDLWAGQDYRPEVWVEKEALVGVFERVARANDVPWFACRGYVSQSTMWQAAERFAEYREAGQTPIILHFGDHDPSGIDMTRDIEDRLRTFGIEDFEIVRLALNMDQIRRFNPPPNPAKDTDSRHADYVRLYGTQSWELDALDPVVLTQLVEDALAGYRDDGPWNAAVAQQETGRELLQATSSRWAEVVNLLSA